MQASPWHHWLVAAVAALGLSGAPAAGAGVAVGQPAPDFRLQDQKGAWHTLADHRGQWVVLYFYPKDQTPGCTTEACSFRDNIFAFEALGAAVLGVSLDDVASHDEFAKKYSLPFPLLADTDGAVTNRYGVMGGFGPLKLAKRQSFLIAPDGTIARHYESVDPGKHSAEVLADLKALGAKKSP
ncbi:MAG: peroxiredoxin [Gammaproteobacteria bacterium]